MTSDPPTWDEPDRSIEILLQKFEFMEGGDEELAFYRRLAEDTFRQVRGGYPVHQPDYREPSPESAGFFLQRWNDGVRLGRCKALPPELERRWREWADRYFEIRRRSPQLEMRDLIQGITERQEGLSWPFHATEDILEEWIVAADFDAPIECEFYFAEYVTRPVFDRLRELRFLTGGWIYDDGRKLRFAGGAEWAREKAEMRERRETQMGLRPTGQGG
jgi:hypothetical protein